MAFDYFEDILMKQTTYMCEINNVNTNPVPGHLSLTCNPYMSSTAPTLVYILNPSTHPFDCLRNVIFYTADKMHQAFFSCTCAKREQNKLFQHYVYIFTKINILFNHALDDS